MPRKIKLLLLLIPVNIGIFYAWAALVLFPFSPFRLLLSFLFLLLPRNLAYSDNFQGNIFPLFILPILLIANFIVFKKFCLETNQNKLKLFVTDFMLSIVPTILALAIIFGPEITKAKLLEYNVVRNLALTGEPTFILQQTARPGHFDFIMRLPVRINTSFKGAWLPNYFDSKFSPSNEQVFSNIPECKLFWNAHFFRGIQPYKLEEYILPGDYNFVFEYNFHGDNCTQQAFKKLIGKKIEVLQITGKPVVLKTFTIDSYQTEVYK